MCIRDSGQTDPSKIQIADLSKTIQDPLLAKVRWVLRKDFNFTQNPQRKFAVDAIFSSQPLIFPKMSEGCEVSATDVYKRQPYNQVGVKLSYIQMGELKQGWRESNTKRSCQIWRKKDTKQSAVKIQVILTALFLYRNG